MAIYHIFAGDDGKSRMVELSCETRPELTRLKSVTGIFLKEFPAGTDLGWHPAPRRQVVIVVSGSLENEVGDGTRRRFDPGDVRIIEDTSGEGHRTRVVGDRPALLAVMPLPDGPFLAG